MIMRTVLTLFITCNAFSTTNCLGMEQEINDYTITPLNNGFLTTVSGIVTKTGYEYDCRGSKKTIEKTFERRDSLINLLHGVGCTKKGSRYNQAYFAPMIIKLTIAQPNNYIEYLGTFNKLNTYRHETKAAINQNKAIFWAHEKGVLIYSIDQQPNPSICEHVNKILKTKKPKLVISQ